MNSTAEYQQKREAITIEVYDPVMFCSTGVCGPDMMTSWLILPNY